MNQKRLIELARRVKGTELYCSDWLMENKGKRRIAKDLEEAHDTLYGRVPPVDPQDPMNPAACLDRAKAYVSQWHDGYRMARVEQSLCVYAPEQSDARVIFENWPGMPTYADYMEALLNLHDLAKLEGGAWAKAWERAMNPEEG